MYYIKSFFNTIIKTPKKFYTFLSLLYLFENVNVNLLLVTRDLLGTTEVCKSWFLRLSQIQSNAGRFPTSPQLTDICIQIPAGWKDCVPAATRRLDGRHSDNSGAAGACRRHNSSQVSGPPLGHQCGAARQGLL